MQLKGWALKGGHAPMCSSIFGAKSDDLSALVVLYG